MLLHVHVRECFRHQAHRVQVKARRARQRAPSMCTSDTSACWNVEATIEDCATQVKMLTIESLTSSLLCLYEKRVKTNRCSYRGGALKPRQAGCIEVASAALQLFDPSYYAPEGHFVHPKRHQCFDCEGWQYVGEQNTSQRGHRAGVLDRDLQLLELSTHTSMTTLTSQMAEPLGVMAPSAAVVAPCVLPADISYLSPLSGKFNP